MKGPAHEGKTIRVLDFEVKEADLKAALRKVLERRGLGAELVVVDRTANKDGLDSDYADYANVYKYAFF